MCGATLDLSDVQKVANRAFGRPLDRRVRLAPSQGNEPLRAQSCARLRRCRSHRCAGPWPGWASHVAQLFRSASGVSPSPAFLPAPACGDARGKLVEARKTGVSLFGARRAWPASDVELQEATDLCADLGLGELLARMPSGMMQLVGETGWQLSHGERSRIFLARALLQRTPLTILDESFAALDPERLALCLDTALAKTTTLLVIAQP